MRLLSVAKFLLVLALPFLLFLAVLNFIGFDNSFYQKEFSDYGVLKSIPQADSLHEKVIDFIKGRISQPPNEFDEKEKQHLFDVRNVISASTKLLYIFIILFVLLLVISSFILKVNSHIINFIGKVLMFGGILTITLAAILLFLIASDFSSAFDFFHRLFFEKGTYIFDPAREMIVNLYPEQLFMDLGARISKWVFIVSAIIVVVGVFLMMKTSGKRQK